MGKNPYRPIMAAAQTSLLGGDSKVETLAEQEIPLRRGNKELKERERETHLGAPKQNAKGE